MDDAVPRTPRTQLSSVSVVIPCYNYGRYLRACAESVLAQVGVDLRVLIVDDASTDDSASVAAQLAAADSRIEVRTHAVNHGHISTYNEGIRWATGMCTVLLDADDLLTPGSLQRACELLEAHPEVGLVYGRALVFQDGGSIPPPSDERGPWTVWEGREWFEMCCRTTQNCIYSPEAVVRSRLLRQVGGYREDLPHSADFELWMRLALHAAVGYIAGPHQACYREHSASMHRVRFGTELADLSQIATAFEILFSEHGHLIADRPRLEESVRRTLAQRALCAAWRAYDRGPWQPTEAVSLEQLAVTIYRGAGALGDMRRLQRRKRLGLHLWRLVHPIWLLVRSLERMVTQTRVRARS